MDSGIRLAPLCEFLEFSIVSLSLLFPNVKLTPDRFDFVRRSKPDWFLGIQIVLRHHYCLFFIFSYPFTLLSSKSLSPSLSHESLPKKWSNKFIQWIKAVHEEWQLVKLYFLFCLCLFDFRNVQQPSFIWVQIQSVDPRLTS